MEALTIWLLAVGIADLLASPSGTIDRRRPPIASTAALAMIATGGSIVVGMSPAGAALLVSVSVLTGGTWLWLRHAQADSWALAVLCAALVGFLAVSERWSAGGDLLTRLLAQTPLPVAADPAYAVLLVALAVFLIASTNSIVRIILGVLETNLLDQELHLKGGRIIGPLERLLIFGLGLTGQLTAAAIVVAAKSLLRFGELREHGGGHGDVRNAGTSRAELRSEYLLVGSLLSWTVAFASVGLALLLRP